MCVCNFNENIQESSLFFPSTKSIIIVNKKKDSKPNELWSRCKRKESYLLKYFLLIPEIIYCIFYSVHIISLSKFYLLLYMVFSSLSGNKMEIKIKIEIANEEWNKWNHLFNKNKPSLKLIQLVLDQRHVPQCLPEDTALELKSNKIFSNVKKCNYLIHESSHLYS